MEKNFQKTGILEQFWRCDTAKKMQKMNVKLVLLLSLISRIKTNPSGTDFTRGGHKQLKVQKMTLILTFYQVQIETKITLET